MHLISQVGQDQHSFTSSPRALAVAKERAAQQGLGYLSHLLRPRGRPSRSREVALPWLLLTWL